MTQEKEKDFGIFFDPPTLIGVKRVQEFLEEKGFPLTTLCFYIPNRGIWHNSENLIKEFGPNVRIWDGLSLCSKESEKRSINFKSSMFGNKETMKIVYMGDKDFVSFVDNHFRRIYRKSSSITFNPFYGGKMRLANPLEAIYTVVGDLLVGRC